MKQKKRTIKKYRNRRLYDTTKGAYITLSDIKKLVIDHIPFQIIDSDSQNDITKITLMQIISEQESTSKPLFTLPILKDLIRLYHEQSQSLFGDYLGHAINLFANQKNFYKDKWQTFQKLLGADFFKDSLKPPKSKKTGAIRRHKK